MTLDPPAAPWAALIDCLPQATWLVELRTLALLAVNGPAAALLGQPLRERTRTKTVKVEVVTPAPMKSAEAGVSEAEPFDRGQSPDLRKNIYPLW